MKRPAFKGALIGCGFFSQNHMNAWADLSGASIVAVCDRDITRARTMAQVHGIEHTYEDAETLFAGEQLDFVDIATTAPSHRPLVELAARHVSTIICQKPFAESYEDALAMVKAADSNGAKLIVHENFRWQRPMVEMKRIIEAGEIGDPHFARFSFRHGYDNYVNQPYLAEIEHFTIMDVGLHLFDLARHFMGEVSHLSCTTQHLNPIVRGEDAFTALLRHQSGATTLCDCSFQSVVEPDPFPRTSSWIEGPMGTLEADAEGRIVLHRSGERQLINAAPSLPAWGESPWHFVQDSVIRFQQHAIDVMGGKAEPQPSGEDNLNTLAMALAAYDAAEAHRTIEMKSWRER